MTTSVDESYRLLAAEYIGKQAQQLAEQLEGARRAEDIEFVHRARVASRRLRAAMRMFDGCFKAKRVKKWRKQIRRVTAGLGEARDKDVQIEFLCGVLDALEDKACYPGIARLLARWEQRRERLQANVVEAADGIESSGVLDQMRAVAKRASSKAKARELGVQSPVAFAQTERHVLYNLDQMLSFQDSLADPAAKQRHHAMRIAAKRLRYTLEISNPVYKGQLDAAITVAKRLQTILGDIHDCDVWAENLQAFAARQRRRIVKHFAHDGPFARLEVGIEHLRQDRRRHREEVFRELGQYWQDLGSQGFWDTLVGLVQSHAQQPAPTRPQPQAEAKVPSATDAKSREALSS